MPKLVKNLRLLGLQKYLYGKRVKTHRNKKLSLRKMSQNS